MWYKSKSPQVNWKQRLLEHNRRKLENFPGLGFSEEEEQMLWWGTWDNNVYAEGSFSKAYRAGESNTQVNQITADETKDGN